MNQKNIVKDIQSKLFELQDIKYRDFHAKLMPTVNKEKIIEFGFLYCVHLQRSLVKLKRQSCFCKCFHIHIMKKIICMVFY